MPYFTKAIHVELAYEGGEVVMLEVLGKHNISESVDVFDVKSLAGGNPIYKL